MPYVFLSDEWFVEVEKLRTEHGDPEPSDAVRDLVVNITVQGAPGGDCEVRIESGRFEMGHIDGAPTKMTVPYDVARAIFVQGDPAAGMQAFMSGQIRVEGDMTKIMALQTAQPSAEAEAMRRRIAEMTE